MNDESPAASGIDAAADRVRETAKWLIAAFASVGAAGSQLSSLGTLDVVSLRFPIAIAGVGFALGAVAVAITMVSEVLVLEPVSLGTIATDAEFGWLRDKLQADRSLVPAGDLAAFETLQGCAGAPARDVRPHQAYLAADIQPNAPSPPRDALFQSAQSADANAQFQASLAQNILAVAGLLRVCRAFKSSRSWLLGSAAVTALGVIAFATAANPPAGHGPVALTKVSAATVTLKPEGMSALRPRLGQHCETSKLPAIVLEVGADAVEVVTLPAPHCAPVRVSLPPRLGTVR